MQIFHDHQYLELIRDVLKHGNHKQDRTGVGTISVFDRHMRFDLRHGTIPLLTTKKMHTRSIIHEILWYMQGGDNIQYLNDNKVTIWDEWADSNGNLGPVYGKQWRQWQSYHDDGITIQRLDPIDQIDQLINQLSHNPDSRRLMVNAWNVGDLNKMALPPCHYSFQCYSRQLTPSEIQQRGTNGQTRELSLKINQRSCDVGLGVPFNIVQYSIIMLMLCHVTNMVPGDMCWSGGDVHIYTNHVEQLFEQLSRNPLPSPTFTFARPVEFIDDFKFEDFIINDYQSHPVIKMDVAV